MTKEIPWLMRAPSVEEVEAHTVAHPIPRAEGLPTAPQEGLWLLVGDGFEAKLRALCASENGIYDRDPPHGWAPAGLSYIKGLKCLPCTAEGVPVFVRELLSDDSEWDSYTGPL